jgi:hypothetical protein
MDKETESSKSRSHTTHARRGESEGVGKHHHHSPRHSVRREHNSPSLSPIRRHKRRSWVDELQGEMNKRKPPTFDGEHKEDEDAEIIAQNATPMHLCHGLTLSQSLLDIFPSCLSKII